VICSIPGGLIRYNKFQKIHKLKPNDVIEYDPVTKEYLRKRRDKKLVSVKNNDRPVVGYHESIMRMSNPSYVIEPFVMDDLMVYHKWVKFRLDSTTSIKEYSEMSAFCGIPIKTVGTLDLRALKLLQFLGFMVVGAKVFATVRVKMKENSLTEMYHAK